MKSCLGILFVFFAFASVIGGGALIWYLSNTAEFSRKDAVSAPAAPPRANVPIPPGVPKANVPIPPAAPKAQPVR